MDKTLTNLIANLTCTASTNAELKARLSSNPYQAMVDFGIPPDALQGVLADPTGQTVASASDSGLTVSKHWWGVQFTFDESYTKLIESGSAAGSAIASIISAAQPELAPVAGIIGGAIALEGAAVGLVDKGEGVHYDLNWAEIWFPPAIPAALIPLANS